MKAKRKKVAKRQPLDVLHPHDQMLNMIRAIHPDTPNDEIVKGEVWHGWHFLHQCAEALELLSVAMDYDHLIAEHASMARQIERWMAECFANCIIDGKTDWVVVPRSALNSRRIQTATKRRAR